MEPEEDERHAADVAAWLAGISAVATLLPCAVLLIVSGDAALSRSYTTALVALGVTTALSGALALLTGRLARFARHHRSRHTILPVMATALAAAWFLFLLFSFLLIFIVGGLFRVIGALWCGN